MAAADALEHEKNKVVEICKKFLQDSFFLAIIHHFRLVSPNKFNIFIN